MLELLARLVLCLHSGRSEFLIIRGRLPGLCALYWRLVFFQDLLRATRRRLFWSVGDCSESGNMIACCRFIILSFFSVPCKCDLWNASSAKSPDGRSVWRHATRDGERPQTGRKFSWGLVWGAPLGMRSHAYTHTHTHAPTFVYLLNTGIYIYTYIFIYSVWQ